MRELVYAFYSTYNGQMYYASIQPAVQQSYDPPYTYYTVQLDDITVLYDCTIS